MEFVADEGVEFGIVKRLRFDGHTVHYILETSRQSEDGVILKTANDLGALLITCDKDFGQLVYQQRLVHTGVIFVRLAGLSNEARADTVSRAIRDRVGEMMGAFTVISPGLIRIRHRNLS